MTRPPETTRATPTPIAHARTRVRLGFRIAPFLLGAVAAQRIDVGGQLYLGELLGILLLPLLIQRGRLPRAERLVVVFGALWVAAQVVSDVVNQTAIGDSLKGVLAPLVFIGTILGLAAYFRTEKWRMPSFLMGVAVGAVVSLAFFPTVYFTANPWKFGVGAAALNVFAVHYSFLLRRKTLAWLFIALVSFLLVSLYYDSRSMAFLPLLAGLGYVLFRGKWGAGFLRHFGGKWGVAKLLPFILIAAFLLNAGATAIFSSERFLSMISPAAAEKYGQQAGGTFGVILGGRSELLVSAQAFLDKPVLGHGSWPKDTSGYLEEFIQKRYELGYSQVREEFLTSPWIPTHSYLMGALVWSGILGGLFWVVILYVLLRRFLDAVGRMPLYFYVGLVGLLWDVLFSPFGASARWASAVFIAAFLAYTRAEKSDYPAPGRSRARARELLTNERPPSTDPRSAERPPIRGSLEPFPAQGTLDRVDDNRPAPFQSIAGLWAVEPPPMDDDLAVRPAPFANGEFDAVLSLGVIGCLRAKRLRWRTHGVRHGYQTPPSSSSPLSNQPACRSSGATQSHVEEIYHGLYPRLTWIGNRIRHTRAAWRSACPHKYGVVAITPLDWHSGTLAPRSSRCFGKVPSLGELGHERIS